MRGLPLTATLLLVASAFSGCAEDTAAPAVTVVPEPVLVTKENDISSLANDSFMMEAHVHDYWDGKERLIIADSAFDTGTTWFGGSRGFKFVPDDNIVVPQGTKRVEVTVTWADKADVFYRTPELWVKTAGDHEAQLLGPAVSGEMQTLETNLSQVDLPHQSVSGWVFEWRIYPGSPVGVAPGLRWQGNITLHVEAVRGADIPTYPAHPDLWNGAETLALFEDEVRATSLWFGSTDDWICFQVCPIIHRPMNGTVVPFDAVAVEVIFTTGADAPNDLGVKFHGGNTRTWADIEAATEDGKTKTFVIPVLPGMGDSPYATQSVWEFALYSTEPQRDSATIGSYTMSARALKVI